MSETDVQPNSKATVGVWLFRLLVVAGGAAMAYTWLQPWWIADVAVIEGTDDLVLHPWGVEVVSAVRAQADPALYSMPGFFKPFAWTYFAVAMLALVASLFVNKRLSLGRINLPLATTLILLVGLSYLVTVGLAYGIGTLRSEAIDVKFIGKSSFVDPMSHRKMKMVSELQIGYWYAVYTAAALFVLGLLRGLFYWKSKS